MKISMFEYTIGKLVLKKATKNKAYLTNSPCKRLGLFAVFAFLLVAIVGATYNPAYAVRVSLKRIVFDNSKRSEILTLINNTAEPKTYRLGWRKYKMTPEASLKIIEEGEDDSGVLWADDMIRYAPRRVTIPPGDRNKSACYCAVQKTFKTPNTDRIYGLFQKSKPEAFEADPANQAQAIRLAVQPAISLPIFVRHGELTGAASISNAKLTRTAEGVNVAFNLNREGNRSIYGDFDFTCNAGGEELVLKQVRGIAVYTEVAARALDFDIPLAENRASNCSAIKITYRADPNDPDAIAQNIAEATATY